MIRRAAQSIKSFADIIKFCIKLTYNASRKYFIFHILVDAISVIVPILSIFISSHIIDFLSQNYGKSESLKENIVKAFIVFIIAFIIVEILDKTLESLKNYIEGLYTDILESCTKKQIMEKSGTLEMFYFDSPDFFDMLGDVNDNSALIIMMAFQVFTFIKFFVQFLIVFISIALWNWLLPLIIVLSVIPSVIINNKQITSIYEFQLTNMKYDRKLSYLTDLAVNRDCAQDVRIYGLMPFLKRKFTETWSDMFCQKKKIVKRYTYLLLILDAIPLILTGVFLFLLGVSVFKGNMTIGDYNKYQGLLGQVTSCVFMVIYNYSQIHDGKIRVSNYVEFMHLESKMDMDGKKIFKDKKFDIEFRNVVFRYGEDSEDVLKNVSFKINSREKIALVGTNGGGKTSIIKLLLRLYDPSEGEILINGTDIREYDVNSIRRCFSPMFQNYFNYSFTAGENISLSDLEYVNDDVKKKYAAEKSGASEFINEFHDEMDTYLTREYEDGEELSGGQWQKIALARTFFRNAEMYILDEPSSALDAESEDELFRHFDELYKDKGAVLVSHRLSNVKNCDRIIVVDNGTIIESGSHKDLIDKNGKYASMFNLQLQKYM